VICVHGDREDQVVTTTAARSDPKQETVQGSDRVV
jgi:hypothetical protein